MKTRLWIYIPSLKPTYFAENRPFAPKRDFMTPSNLFSKVFGIFLWRALQMNLVLACVFEDLNTVWNASSMCVAVIKRMCIHFFTGAYATRWWFQCLSNVYSENEEIDHNWQICFHFGWNHHLDYPVIDFLGGNFAHKGCLWINFIHCI